MPALDLEPRAYGDWSECVGPLTKEEFEQYADELPRWVSNVADKLFSGEIKSSVGKPSGIIFIQDSNGNITSIAPGIHEEKGVVVEECHTLESYRQNQALPLWEDQKKVRLDVDEDGRIIDESVKDIELFARKHALPERHQWGNDPIPGDNWQEAPAAMSEKVRLQEQLDFSVENALPANHVLMELIREHNGVFLGERHDMPNVRQMVTHLMPQLKSAGVTNISFETQQSIIDEFSACKSIEEATRKFPGMAAGSPSTITSLYDLTQAAKEHGIRIIGHEAPAIDEKLFRQGVEWTLHDTQILGAASDRLIGAVSDDGLAQRDEWSAEHIRKHAVPGKTIIIGGALHSTHSNIDNETGYQGLNRLLGFPAIDGVHLTEGRFHSIPLGTAVPNQGNGADYYMRLPDNISHYMRDRIKPGVYEGTSWPPPEPQDILAREAEQRLRESHNPDLFRQKDIDEVLRRAIEEALPKPVDRQTPASTHGLPEEIRRKEEPFRGVS